MGLVISHVRRRSVRHENASCHACECAMAHRLNVQCYACECIMSHMWMRHVAHLWMYHVATLWICHVTNVTCHNVLILLLLLHTHVLLSFAAITTIEVDTLHTRFVTMSMALILKGVFVIFLLLRLLPLLLWSSHLGLLLILEGVYSFYRAPSIVYSKKGIFMVFLGSICRVYVRGRTQCATHDVTVCHTWCASFVYTCDMTVT